MNKEAPTTPVDPSSSLPPTPFTNIYSSLITFLSARSFHATHIASASISTEGTSPLFFADAVPAFSTMVNSTQGSSPGDPYTFVMFGSTPEYWFPVDVAMSFLGPSKTTYHAVLLPTLALFTVLALIIPFTLHLRLRNTGAWNLILVVILCNIMAFINALIWPNADFSKWYNGVGICDVEVKLKTPLHTALAACTLCIIRSLCHVLDIDRCSINPSRTMKRRGVYTDLLICWGIPVCIMAVCWVVQPNRYIIKELSGCSEAYATTWMTILLIYIWPILFVAATVWYTILTLHRLRLHRHSISNLLSLASLPSSRFLRLFLLSTSILLVYLPTQIYFMVVNFQYTLDPFDFDHIHGGNGTMTTGWGLRKSWNSVGYIKGDGVWLFEVYMGIAQALLIFVFFGLGSEAKRTYRRIAIRLRLHKLFPGLAREGSNGRASRSWLTRFSPIRWLRGKFDVWIGNPVHGSEGSGNWDSGREMLGSEGQATEMTESACNSRKGSAAVIEYAVPAHPLAVLGSGQSQNGWVTDGVEMRNIGVLPPVSSGRRQSEFGHSQRTTLDAHEREANSGTSWLKRFFHRPATSTISSTKHSSSRLSRSKTTMDNNIDLEMTGGRGRGDNRTHTEIWSEPRNSIGDMNGRYGRLDSAASIAPHITESKDTEEGVRVQKVVGIVSEVAVAKYSGKGEVSKELQMDSEGCRAQRVLRGSD